MDVWCGLWGKIPDNTPLLNAEIHIEEYFDDNAKVRGRMVRRFEYSS